jgi:hypothetical protein
MRAALPLPFSQLKAQADSTGRHATSSSTPKQNWCTTSTVVPTTTST